MLSFSAGIYEWFSDEMQCFSIVMDMSREQVLILQKLSLVNQSLLVFGNACGLGNDLSQFCDGYLRSN